MKKFAFLFVFIAFFVAACGGSDGDSDFDKLEKAAEDENGSDKKDDQKQETVVDDEGKELLYPEVTPTANKAGDIVPNIIMYDDLDEKHQLAEWYQANNPSSKVIWLIFTTYDCPPCKVLKKNLSEVNKKEFRDKGLNIVLIFNGLLDPGPIPEQEPARLAAYKDDYLYVYPDTGQFAIYAYLKEETDQNLFYNKFASDDNGVAYPTYVLVDAETMEILIYGQGWTEEMTSSMISNIELVLDDYI